MAVVVHNMSAILADILDFSKNITLPKTASYYLEISRKNLFATSNSNIIKNGTEKTKLEQNLSKSYGFLI